MPAYGKQPDIGFRPMGDHGKVGFHVVALLLSSIMIANLALLCLGAWGLWHFGRSTYIAFKKRYVMWSYSRASAGSRVYEVDDPRRFRIGFWANITGVGLMIAAVGVLTHELFGLGAKPSEPPFALCDAPYIEHSDRKCRAYGEWTDTEVHNLPQGGCTVCNDMVRRDPAKDG